MQVTQLQLIYAAELVGFLLVLILILSLYGHNIRKHYFKAVGMLTEWVAQEQQTAVQSISYDDYLNQAIEETEAHLRNVVGQSNELSMPIDTMEMKQFTALLRAKFLRGERSAIQSSALHNEADWKQVEENMLLLVDEIEAHLAKRRRQQAVSQAAEPPPPNHISASGLGEVEWVHEEKERSPAAGSSAETDAVAEELHTGLMGELTHKLTALEESKEQALSLQERIMEQQRSLLDPDSASSSEELLQLLAQDSLDGHQALLRMERQIEQAEKILSRAILATKGREEIDALQQRRDRLNRERMELKELQNCLVTLDRETEMASKRNGTA